MNLYTFRSVLIPDGAVGYTSNKVDISLAASAEVSWGGDDAQGNPRWETTVATNLYFRRAGTIRREITPGAASSISGEGGGAALTDRGIIPTSEMLVGTQSGLRLVASIGVNGYVQADAGVKVFISASYTQNRQAIGVSPQQEVIVRYPPDQGFDRWGFSGYELSAFIYPKTLDPILIFLSVRYTKPSGAQWHHQHNVQYEFQTVRGAMRTEAVDSPDPNRLSPILEFASKAMKRSNYSVDEFTRKNNLTISFQGGDSFARMFLAPSVADLTVDIAQLSNQAVFFRGKLVTVRYISRQGNDTIDMVFEPLVQVGKAQQGERRIFQRNCPYRLYSLNCGVDINADSTPKYQATVMMLVNSRTLKVSYDTGNSSNASSSTPFDQFDGNSLGIFIGGMLKSNDQFWWITNILNPTAVGANIIFDVLLAREYGTAIALTNTVTLYFGCKRTLQACGAFNNEANFGGFPSLLKASPFDTGDLRVGQTREEIIGEHEWDPD